MIHATLMGLRTAIIMALTLYSPQSSLFPLRHQYIVFKGNQIMQVRITFKIYTTYTTFSFPIHLEQSAANGMTLN